MEKRKFLQPIQIFGKYASKEAESEDTRPPKQTNSLKNEDFPIRRLDQKKDRKFRPKLD